MLDGEIVTHGFISEERMPDLASIIDQFLAVDQFRLGCCRFIIAKCCHRHECIHHTHLPYPFIYGGQVVLTPPKKTADEKEITEEESVEQHQSQQITTTVEAVKNMLQFLERL